MTPLGNEPRELSRIERLRSRHAKLRFFHSADVAVRSFRFHSASARSTGRRRRPAVDVSIYADATEALKAGEELENSRQWVDAIVHYEAALERFKNDEGLSMLFAELESTSELTVDIRIEALSRSCFERDDQSRSTCSMKS